MPRSAHSEQPTVVRTYQTQRYQGGAGYEGPPVSLQYSWRHPYMPSLEALHVDNQTRQDFSC